MVKKPLNVIYHWFPHYREPIFSQINDAFDLTLVGDVVTNYESLKLLDITKFNFIRVRNKWFGPFLFQVGLFSYIKHNNDKNFIFLADWKFLATWFVLLFIRKKDKKFIGWTHGLSSGNKFIQLIYYRLFDEILTYNETAARLLNSKGVKSRPIYNSINYSNKIPKKTGDEINWIFIGRIIKNRLLEHIFIDMSKNKKDLGSTIFHIVGPCDYLDELKDTIGNLQLKDHVVFHGEIYDFNVILDISSGCKYFIHPSDVGLSALLAIKLNLILFTHNNFNTHKPEFEASLETGMLKTYSYRNDVQVSQLLNSTENIEINSAIVQKIANKWSIENQILILNSVCDG
jgi:glycosyltransferase involved in cell wall biosynthesis